MVEELVNFNVWSAVKAKTTFSTAVECTAARHAEFGSWKRKKKNSWFNAVL